jgi:hypothetical protein
MRRTLCGPGLVLVLILAGAAPAADKNAAKADMASDQDYTALGQLKEVTGKVVSVNATDKSFTLQIDMAKANPKGNQNLARTETHAAQEQERLQRQEQDILRTRDPIQRAQKMQRLAADIERQQAQQTQQAARQANNTVTVHKDFDLDAAADAKVRRQDPPVQYDDKGNVKKYTEKELKELKGPDTKLPGYAADWSDLKVGQMVKITLTKAQDKKDNNDNKDKNKADTKPRASQVLIVKEAPEDADQGGKKKK